MGRIRISGDRAVIVTIDGGAERLAPGIGFVAYVTPGRTHVVTFDPGTKDEHRVEVRIELGQVVEVSPPRPKVMPPAPLAPTPLPATRFEVREERPYDRSVLYIAAGVTAASALVPVILYANASAVRSDYDAAREGASRAAASEYAGLAGRADRLSTDYESARSIAYASLAIPAALGVATLGLTTYWLVATKETRVPIAGSVVPGGGGVVASGRF